MFHVPGDALSKAEGFHVPCEGRCVADALSAVPEAPEGTAGKAKPMGSKIKVQGSKKCSMFQDPCEESCVAAYYFQVQGSRFKD